MNPGEHREARSAVLARRLEACHSSAMAAQGNAERSGPARMQRASNAARALSTGSFGTAYRDRRAADSADRTLAISVSVWSALIWKRMDSSPRGTTG